ncbi:hypothetical protein BHM03_00020003 [Ensete ventricosum]|nr:hypothetical protein BHM03_00020003 [Ensete ventricosum]
MGRLSVHQTRGPKQGKGKKKTVKVVYISNPMWFTTSVVKFRALVQKLTGRDSNVGDTGGTSIVLDGLEKLSAQPTPGSGVASDSTGMDPGTATASAAFEMFDDDVFTPEMLDNFAALQQSTLCDSTIEVSNSPLPRAQAFEMAPSHSVSPSLPPSLSLRVTDEQIPEFKEAFISFDNDGDVWYSPLAEKAQSRAPNGKRNHKERLTMAETYLDVLEASLKEVY